MSGTSDMYYSPWQNRELCRTGRGKSGSTITVVVGVSRERR